MYLNTSHVLINQAGAAYRKAREEHLNTSHVLINLRVGWNMQ